MIPQLSDWPIRETLGSWTPVPPFAKWSFPERPQQTATNRSSSAAKPYRVKRELCATHHASASCSLSLVPGLRTEDDWRGSKQNGHHIQTYSCCSEGSPYYTTTLYSTCGRTKDVRAALSPKRVASNAAFEIL